MAAGNLPLEQRQERTPVLDPPSRVSEIIFGLLMTLSFTGSLSVATAGREEVRTVLVAAIGCTLAWGVVDAVMYLVGALTERARARALWREIRDANPSMAPAMIADALPRPLVAAIGTEGLEGLRQRLIALPEPPPRAGFVWEDFVGAGGVFLLVVLATFPIVIPFIFISDTTLAMRVSNAVAVAMLFAAGRYLGSYAGIVPWRAGLAIAAIGAALVSIIVALGG